MVGHAGCKASIQEGMPGIEMHRSDHYIISAFGRNIGRNPLQLPVYIHHIDIVAACKEGVGEDPASMDGIQHKDLHASYSSSNAL